MNSVSMATFTTGELTNGRHWGFFFLKFSKGSHSALPSVPTEATCIMCYPKHPLVFRHCMTVVVVAYMKHRAWDIFLSALPFFLSSFPKWSKQHLPIIQTSKLVSPQMPMVRHMHQNRSDPTRHTCSSSLLITTSWAPTSLQAVTESCQFCWNLEKK